MGKRKAMRACTAALVAAALGLASGACSSEEPGEARYIRRFVPFPTEWELVSREPSRPEREIMEMWEVSQYPPGTQPTLEQQEAADQLIERGERAVEKLGWEDFEKASADGFTLLTNDRGGHYYNLEYVTDDIVLDPERPEFLMYYGTPQGMRLVGFMFYVAELMDRGPQIGGPLTVWHYHLFVKAVCRLGLRKRGREQDLLRLAEADERGRCALGVPVQRGPEMLHVWLIDHPLGRFGTRMHIPPEFLSEALAKRDRALAVRQPGN
jgi:hypothetical protein